MIWMMSQSIQENAGLKTAARGPMLNNTKNLPE
jgi:hypothetical protein